MADDFKIAGAYVEVHLRDHTSGDEKKIRAKLEGDKPVSFDTALKDPKNTKAIKDKIERGPAANIRAEVDEKGARDSARKAGKGVEDEMSRVAGRANAEFDAMKFTALSVGLPAAAAIGVAGATASLALLPAAFAVWAVMVASDNDEVSRSFGQLSDTVQSSAGEMANQLNGEVLAATDDLQAAFVRLRPQINAAFAGSRKAVEPLVGAGTDLIENLMPGVVVAINSAQPALLGLRSFAGQTGAGLSDFFTNASKGSEGAQRGFTIFGGTVALLEGRLGTLFANLANGSAGPLTQLHVIVDQVTGAVVDLTDEGSAGISFLAGFGSSAVGTVTILRGLLGVLDLLPPGVTQLGGSVVATGMLLSRMGVDVGAGFRGLGTEVRAAGSDLTGAAKAGAKTGTALGGLVAGALHPATLAVAGLGIGLAILGHAQEQAAAAASAHRERVSSLATALAESNGVLDANTRAVAAKALQDFKMADGTRNLLGDVQATVGPAGLPLLTDAYLGNADAGKTLEGQLRATAKAHTAESGEMDTTAVRALDLLGVIGSLGGPFADAIQKNKDLATATAGTGQAAGKAQKDTSELGVAMMTLRDGAAKAEDRVSALKVALDVLSGRTPTFEEAIQAGNDQIRSFAEGLKDGVTKADGFGKSLLNLDGTVNTSTANGSKLQDFAVGLQDSFTTAAAGIDQMVRRGVPLDEAVRRVNDGLTTQRDRFIDNAQKMGLTATEAGKLADKYGLIPKEITTEVTANTKQGEDAIKALPLAAANSPGVVPISANTDAATGKVNATVRYADGSLGVITLDANKDPATGKTMVAVQYANGQRSFMNIDAFNQAAKDRTIEAKRMADGTVAWILVNADTSSANSAIDYAARNRLSTINVRTVITGNNTNAQTGRYAMNADGNYYSPNVGFANGGFPVPTKANSFNGLAQVVAPGTYKWAGDAKVPEIFAPLNGSERTKGLLTKAVEHEGLLAPVGAAAPMKSSTSGTTFAPVIHIHPPADMDIHALAALVSRDLEMRSKTGAFG